MKILLVNKFLYPKGGDAISTVNTGTLLATHGHQVAFWGMDNRSNPYYPHRQHFVSNVDYDNPGGLKQQITMAVNMLYSIEAKRKFELMLRATRPDIVHLNNFAHQISPSILHVLKQNNIPSVMTMRDYKLICPVYSLLLKGKPCQLCAKGKYYQCLINKCSKDSYLKSFLNTAEMYLHHKILNIYDLIDVFISPSQFLKAKLLEMGFKRDIVHLPNFALAPQQSPAGQPDRKTICYVGRLSHEKGIFTLIQAVKGIDVNLKIIGDGPLKESAAREVNSRQIDNVQFLGYISGDALHAQVASSLACVLPSECYENNPRTIIEAFCLARPVIGARIGGIPELVKDGQTGLTFEPGNVADLRSKIAAAISNPGRMADMGNNAKRFAQENLNPDKHYEQLIRIYQDAMTG